MTDIVLTTINAKWIHPSLALRLLKANLGTLEPNCEIMEFNLRQPLREKLEPLLAANPKILGISVSIWNHLAAFELLKNLKEEFAQRRKGAENTKEREDIIFTEPVVVLGGPEVTHLPADAEIFKYADHVIRGEGEIAFRELCENILQKEVLAKAQRRGEGEEIKSAYHLYSDEDAAKKLIYVESSRGCPFKCDFCQSALDEKIYEFPLEPFLNDMDKLIQRGVKTFKFLDRSFNTNIKRALKIINFFLDKIEQSPHLPLVSFAPSCLCESSSLEIPHIPFTVHFEMVPSLFPNELIDALSRFPPGTLRLEIGIQTLNPEVSARINRPSNPEKELEILRLLTEKTSAIIHADLIAGLPGEDIESFGKGFDRLWLALNSGRFSAKTANNAEIQLGILKQLPGTPISRHIEGWGMRFDSLPPYEIMENSAINACDLLRLRNFARFWTLIINRRLLDLGNKEVFNKFLLLSDDLYAHFGRNWGIDKAELIKKAQNITA